VVIGGAGEDLADLGVTSVANTDCHLGSDGCGDGSPRWGRCIGSDDVSEPGRVHLGSPVETLPTDVAGPGVRRSCDQGGIRSLPHSRPVSYHTVVQGNSC
jgi:hypothetical protein